MRKDMIINDRVEENIYNIDNKGLISLQKGFWGHL